MAETIAPSVSRQPMDEQLYEATLLSLVVTAVEEDRQCTVCLEPIDVTEPNAIAACNHITCQPCMHAMMLVRRTNDSVQCPSCRADNTIITVITVDEQGIATTALMPFPERKVQSSVARSLFPDDAFVDVGGDSDSDDSGESDVSQPSAGLPFWGHPAANIGQLSVHQLAARARRAERRRQASMDRYRNPPADGPGGVTGPLSDSEDEDDMDAEDAEGDEDFYMDFDDDEDEDEEEEEEDDDDDDEEDDDEVEFSDDSSGDDTSSSRSRTARTSRRHSASRGGPVLPATRQRSGGAAAAARAVNITRRPTGSVRVAVAVPRTRPMRVYSRVQRGPPFVLPSEGQQHNTPAPGPAPVNR